MESDTYSAASEISSFKKSHRRAVRALPLVRSRLDRVGRDLLERKLPEAVGAREYEWIDATQASNHRASTFHRAREANRFYIASPSFYRVAITEPPVALCVNRADAERSPSFRSRSSFDTNFCALLAFGAFDTRTSRGYPDFRTICRKRDVNRG